TLVVDFFEKLAIDGNAKAQYIMALMYCFGYGVNQNMEASMKWYDLSGSTGKKINDDFSKDFSIVWCQFSAFHGNPKAIEYLLDKYIWDQARELDFTVVVDLFKKLAD